MNKDGIPLPSVLSGDIQERLVRIDESLLFLVLGALVELTDEWWLEQTGTLTVQQAKDALNEMLWCFQEGCDVTPVGTVQMWVMATPPAKWLICNAQSVLRAAYPKLFALIGTTFGAVDGTHFTLPDFKDYSPMGAASTVALNAAAGSFLHPISVAEMPIHKHAITDPGHVHRERVTNGTNAVTYTAAGGTNFSVNSVATLGTAALNTGSATTGIADTDNNGSSTPMSILHPVKGVHFIIYAGDE